MSTRTAGDRIAERYRLDAELARGSQGVLWRASDALAGDAAVVLRCLGPDQPELQARFRALWPRLQGVLHPQVPRFGELIEENGSLWLVREWQEGRTYGELLQARRERQLVFGCGEVLLLLRQLLPVLMALHGQQLVHGDLTPANLLRRERDGLPVLLDFGLLRGAAPLRDGEGWIGVTPGYAPPELGRGDPAEGWMDLHSLAVVALVLLSGQEPAQLLDPVSLQWRWPGVLDGEPALRAALARLLSPEPAERFPSAAAALELVQQITMPDSTGPVARADRTIVLVPPPAPPEAAVPDGPPPSPAAAAPAAATPAPRPVVPLRTRKQQKDEEAEGRVWPVVLALVASAVVGTGLGWLLLGRGRLPAPSSGTPLELPANLPAAEVDERQQLLNRLRALQIEQSWFLRLVDASLLAQYPQRGGRLPGDGAADAPLRRLWNELAEQWLSRVEQLPLELRVRLGSFGGGDWRRRQEALVEQGFSPAVLEQLVSGSAQNLLPGRVSTAMPPEPYRQLWFAAAEQVLAGVRIEPIQSRPGQTSVLSASVHAGGARLFPIRISGPSRLVLGVNGSPLMQMTVFGADGEVLEARGPLRVVSLSRVMRSPVQLLVTNQGVAAAMLTLSLRPDALPGSSSGAAPPVSPPAVPSKPDAEAAAGPGSSAPAPGSSTEGPSSPPAPN